MGSNLGDNLAVDKVTQYKVNKDHPVENIIGDASTRVLTRSSLKKNTSMFVELNDTGILESCLYSCFISQQEPRNVQLAIKEPSWVQAMKEELAQFEKL